MWYNEGIHSYVAFCSFVLLKLWDLLEFVFQCPCEAQGALLRWLWYEAAQKLSSLASMHRPAGLEHPFCRGFDSLPLLVPKGWKFLGRWLSFTKSRLCSQLELSGWAALLQEFLQG